MLDARTVFAHMADLLFQPRDFGIGFVERTLARMQCVTRLVVLTAQLFHALLGGAQIGGFGFELDAHALNLARISCARGDGFLLARKPQQVLRRHQFRLQGMVALGHLRLIGQVFQLFTQFLPDVIDTPQVFAGVAQARFRLLAALAVFGYTRGFFQKDAQFFGLGLDHARDHALLDDGVGARAQPRAEEDVRDIAAAHRQIVDVVSGVTIALQHALDGYLSVGGPLPRRLAQAVIE